MNFELKYLAHLVGITSSQSWVACDSQNRKKMLLSATCLQYAALFGLGIRLQQYAAPAAHPSPSQWIQWMLSGCCSWIQQNPTESDQKSLSSFCQELMDVNGTHSCQWDILYQSVSYSPALNMGQIHCPCLLQVLAWFPATTRLPTVLRLLSYRQPVICRKLITNMSSARTWILSRTNSSDSDYCIICIWAFWAPNEGIVDRRWKKHQGGVQLRHTEVILPNRWTTHQWKDVIWTWSRCLMSTYKMWQNKSMQKYVKYVK